MVANYQCREPQIAFLVYQLHQLARKNNGYTINDLMNQCILVQDGLYSLWGLAHQYSWATSKDHNPNHEKRHDRTSPLNREADWLQEESSSSMHETCSARLSLPSFVHATGHRHVRSCLQPNTHSLLNILACISSICLKDLHAITHNEKRLFIQRHAS